ncbi:MULTISPECIES: hypothetical protein [unclassified Sulfitobacter]|uniref:hypothetical protein n=1 Tax=unclassified Sulfitobacter TaxID=196795 RepID=UPI0007C32A5A|nr:MULTISPECIES: hypothetical protein [unclassified Sulfitobacter]KZY05232.1 hypothetical protein A3721_14975 [Sulfitobacter sp. HI0023]KZY25622.1 hypothetical protein A3728_18355 [Sulfitobacter sp. HI0040]KZZ66203.1 hypothetical protein A3764_17620 [Sulfitobacter sp. HI0129]
MFDIDPKKLEKLVVKEAADQLLSQPDENGGERFDRIQDDIRISVESRIDRIFAERATAMIEDALDKAITEGFEREYSKVDQWGNLKGQKTSISKELERLVSSYWSERVDRSGKPTESTYSSISRAEYLMTKICAEDFSETMKTAATNITGALKDGLRNQMAEQMDKMLKDLFRVKSLQDQGKVEKPY